MSKQLHTSNNSIASVLKGIGQNFMHELKTAFRDRGVVIMIILGPLVYPLLYATMYLNETVENIPVGVVDQSHSAFSRQITRNLDATESMQIYSHYSSLAEAQQAFENREIHGIIYIPKELNTALSNNKQATVSVYCDVSSFMYYRAIYQSSNYCILNMNKNIQLQRLNAAGVTGQSASVIIDPMPYQNISLFNAGAGFSSFLIPAILVLIVFQTLFLAITMLAGTSRGENRFHELVSSKAHKGRIFRVITGKAALYFMVYSVWVFYSFGIIPQLFNLPHIGNHLDVLKLMIPFLLATIFFSMSISVFMSHRETSMMLFMFFSIILLFLSGITWPQSNINGFWRAFAWIFPSTHGVQGYIKINSMGAGMHEVEFEYLSLWIQTGVYLLTTIVAYRWQIMKTIHREAKGGEELCSNN